MRATVLTLLCLLACGARTELPNGLRSLASDAPTAGSSTGGTGGVESSTTGTPTGSVGGGGADPGSTTGTMTSTGTGAPLDTVCDVLTPNGAVTPIPTLGPGTADNTRFHALDAGRTAVFHRPFDSTLGLRLASTTVEWADAWPPKTSPPVLILADLKLSFAIDFTANPLVALLTPNPLGPGVGFGKVAPASGNWSAQVVTDFAADRALFVRYGLGTYFMAMSHPSVSPGGSTQLRAAFYDGVQLRGPYNVGCSTKPVTTDALALTNGWLLVRSGPQVPSCNPSIAAPEPVEVSVDFIVNGMPFVSGQLPFGGTSSQLVLVPRADGAWLLFWSNPTTLSGIALDGFGKVLGVLPLATLTENPFAFAAQKLDDGMVVVLYDAPSEAPSAIEVLVFNASGTLLATASIKDPPKLTTPPQVAFDSVTRQVLVGFNGLVNAVQSVYLARFGCH